MEINRRLLLTGAPAAAGFSVAPSRVDAQQASRTMVVYSGQKAGTYHRLMEELAQFCPGQLENKESDGSLANIDRVMNNQAEMGMTQLDALYLRGQKEKDLKERIRVLAVLHPEEIHFIAKSASRRTIVRTFPFYKEVVLNTINDLKGLSVGVWGGAIVTEQIIAALALPGWRPVEMNDQATAIAALGRDEIDAILAVGGQPLEWVSQLDRDYKLLEVPDSVSDRLSTVYDKTTLAYRNLGQDGVATLSVKAVLVTRNYASSGMRDRLQALRSCLAKNIGDIRETRGTHRKWNEIDPAITTEKWTMYLQSSK